MARLIKDESLVAKWKTFFENEYKSELETIASVYPTKKSIYIDFIRLDSYDQDLANQVLNNPYATLFNAEQAIGEIETCSDYRLNLHVRLKNLLGTEKIPIRHKSAIHIGKIRTIEGVIRKQTDVRMKPIVAAFQCQKCGAVIHVEQDEDILKEPSECYESDGGCGRASTFKFLPNQSLLVDCMKLQLQECTEDISGQNQPKNISVSIEDDLVNPTSLTLGDRVNVTGIFSIVPRYRGGRQLVASDFSFNALSFSIEKSSYRAIEINDDDIKEIRKCSSDPLIYDKLVQSISPSLYGLESEKEAILLQLFGSHHIDLPDGIRVRGDIHVLLIGDPGCAKSQLLRRASQLAPKGIFATGTSSTAAGITAAAVKDEFSDGQWSLEAGALVLADMGVACIDELDKMNEHDRNSLHTAMEQQVIPINKAGINVELPARCSILAAANPKFGNFDVYQSLYEQINLPSTLVSRFDLIFTIIDQPNKKVDAAKAEHVLRARQLNKKYFQIEPIFNEDFIRKFVIYAKEHCNPILSDESLDVLKDFYIETRCSSNESITITIRQLESLIRLSTASARIRLSDVVTIDDANRAIKIYSQFIGSVATDWETGRPDIQRVSFGVSHSQQERMQKILGVVRALRDNEDSKVVEKSLIFGETDIVGIPAERVEEALHQLVSQKVLFELNGKYGVNE